MKDNKEKYCRKPCEKSLESEKFYITTPIYYPSGNWHIGHCYTTVICDAIARFNRMLGKDVFFLTGTDEHGQKIEKSAAAAGKSPIDFVNERVNGLKKLWETLGISYSKFIRTTDEDHKKQVQKIFRKLYDKGDIYKSQYEGWYCAPCESFWTDTQAEGGKCPDCGRQLERAKEESYFFRLSSYTERIIKYYEDNPEFLQPKTRVNEMLNNFLKPGLEDLCVSRTSFKWGVPVDFDDGHVVYVWVDALSNYITALGAFNDDDSLFNRYWPADVHMMAKEIIRFHSIIWPALLMALDLPLPKKVYGHGWLLIGGDKLSKSKSEKAKKDLVDPFLLTERYGADSIRYFLLREIPFGQDGVYTNEALISRINSDLANDLGNLLSRAAAMIIKYFDGVIPAPETPVDEKDVAVDAELKELCLTARDDVKSLVDQLLIPDAISRVFKIVQRANKYNDENAPWQLAKSEENRGRLATVLYNLAESLRFAGTLLSPFLPHTTPEIFRKMGFGNIPDNFDSLAAFDENTVGCVIARDGGHLFERLDMAKETADLEKIASELAQKAAEENKAVLGNAAPQGAVNVEEITIDDFKRIQLKTGVVLSCEKVKGSSKLLKFAIDCKEETPRQILSGIAQFYSPDDLIGKTVVFVSNLKPAKLCGQISNGMILCAETEDGSVKLLTVDGDDKHFGCHVS